MKKILLISLMATSLFVTGCDKSKENGGEYQMENCTNETAFYAGNIVDNTDENSEKIYKLKAMVTDQYLSNCATATDIIFYDNKGNVIQEQCNNTQIQLTKGQTYFIKIKTASANENFYYQLYPVNNHVVTPYEINTTTDLSKFDVSSVDGTVIESAEIDYQQRKGGTYLYSNVPESMPSEVLDTILMRHLDLTGECFLTLGSKNASTYKDKNNPKIDENTAIRMDDGPEKGVPHFYADIEIIPKLFKKFKIEYIAQVQDFKQIENGFRSFWHYLLLIRKI